MQQVGALSKAVDKDLFHDVLKNFSGVDWKIYAHLLHRLDEHDTTAHLADIDVPVSIIVGDRDLITPVEQSEALHRQIRGAHFAIVAGGTHYVPCEYPAVVGRYLRSWLDRVPGWEQPTVAKMAVAR